jgi:hypothetical protein
VYPSAHLGSLAVVEVCYLLGGGGAVRLLVLCEMSMKTYAGGHVYEGIYMRAYAGGHVYEGIYMRGYTWHHV